MMPSLALLEMDGRAPSLQYTRGILSFPSPFLCPNPLALVVGLSDSLATGRLTVTEGRGMCLSKGLQSAYLRYLIHI